VVARNAAHRLKRSPHERREHKLTLPERENLSALIAQVRSATQTHQRTGTKVAIAAIRARLDPDDQMLLVLRVDKGMSFRELAQVMNDGDLPDARVDDEAARLRKRFERVKAQIREIARAEGLLGDDRDD
jgi:RNA polymerase sigma-70 factor, ECF subfamily